MSGIGRLPDGNMPALSKVGKPVWDSELPTLLRPSLGWNLRASVRERHGGRGWALKEGHGLTFGLEWGGVGGVASHKELPIHGAADLFPSNFTSLLSLSCG